MHITYAPQRSDIKAEYTVAGDVLTVKVGSKTETFDFNTYPDGVAQEIVAEKLPVNPVVAAEKHNGEMNVTVIRYYGEDEKGEFEHV
jgi:hypothetical protein